MSPAFRLAGRSARTRVVAILFLLLAANVTLARAATLRGIVRDPQGAAVASVRVTIVGPLGASLVYSDADGRFEIPNLPAATYRVIAEIAGLRADPGAVVLSGDETRDMDVSLSIAPMTESVVVSASQVEVAHADAPASVTVVDRATLEARQSEDLAGALFAVPGLTVSRNGGRGSLTSVFPRGGESDYTLFLVDGMRLNQFGGEADLSQLALGNVERVEIVRGPQSAIYGSDAIGGVVQVVTMQDGPTRGEALVEGGSQSTSRALGTAAGRAGRWTWSGSIERDASDGFSGTAPANGEPVVNDDSLQRQVAGSAGWQPSADTSVRVHLRAFDSERGFPGPYGSNPIGAFPGVDAVSRGDNEHRQVGVAATHPWGHLFSGRVRQRWSATYGDLDSNFTSAFGPSTFDTRRLGFRSQTDVAVTATGSLTAGIEGQSERARSTYIVGPTTGQVPIERSVIGTFAEWRQALPAGVSLTGGVRLERIRRDALPGDPNAFDPRPAFPSDTVWSANPRVSVAWSPSRAGALRIHASAGTGIRPPDAFEIAFTDNPGLKPERSQSVEGGASYTVARGLELDATLFRNEYDDLIVTVGRSLENASQYRTDNVSNALAWGLETSGRWRPVAGVSIQAAYTFLSTEILAVDRTASAPPPFSVGDPLIRRPRHQGSLETHRNTSPRHRVCRSGCARAHARHRAELRRVRRPLSELPASSSPTPA